MEEEIGKVVENWEAPENESDAEKMFQRYILNYVNALDKISAVAVKKRLNHKFCGISDSSRSSVGSYRIASERNIRHQDIRIPVCEES